MKTRSFLHESKGSVLLVTLVVTGILGLTLASYLTLISAQNRSVARSQVWNSSIPVCEAGVEEAIVHLNKNCLWSDVTRTPVHWDADGWQPVTDGIQKSNSIGDTYYIVTIITNAPYSTNGPGIFSRGYVPSLFSANASDAVFAAIGTEAAGAQPAYVGRQVRVTTGRDGFMTRAMVAKSSINLNGNNIETDSFDSSDPAYSTDGLYDSTKNKDNGDVAVNGDFENSLNVGNANIYGAVAVGPGGEISIGPNGKVGDAAWMADSTKTGIQPGRSRDDMNVSFPDVSYTGTPNSNPDLNVYVTNNVITASNTITTSVSYPTGSGTVYTNTTPQVTTSYPTPGTYIGSVITNLAEVTTVTFPSAGTYIGTVATNTTSTTTTGFPSAGTYVGTPVTNIIWTTSSTYPTDPYGSVITNYIGNSGKVRNYSFQQITGYTFEKITGYTYNKIDGYTVAHITGYNLVQSVYFTNQVTEFYNYVFSNGTYECSTLSGKVLVCGDATVHVTGDIDMSGSSDIIQINPDAKLKLYMEGSTFKLTGNSVVNASGKAENFWYFGLPSNTDVHFGGNAAFTGVIYAPEADLHLGGGGNDTWDFIGATVTKTVQMNGHFRFHYDEALARTGPSRGYIISGWDEIAITETAP